MKDSIKIALGVFLGLLAAGLCALCLLFVVSIGGLNILSEELESFEETIEPQQFSTETPIHGHIEKCDDLGFKIVSYREANQCPSSVYGENKPAEGAKFIIATVEMTNFTNDVIEIPSIDFKLDNYESGLGSGSECRYDDESFGNSCWQWNRKLYPSVTCQGWIMFEVPKGFETNKANLHVLFIDRITGVDCEGQWPLEPPD